VPAVAVIKTSFGTLARSVDQEADPRKVIKSAVAIVPHQASRAKANARDLGRQAIANPGMEGRKEGRKERKERKGFIQGKMGVAGWPS